MRYRARWHVNDIFVNLTRKQLVEYRGFPICICAYIHIELSIVKILSPVSPLLSHTIAAHRNTLAIIMCSCFVLYTRITLLKYMCCNMIYVQRLLAGVQVRYQQLTFLPNSTNCCLRWHVVDAFANGAFVRIIICGSHCHHTCTQCTIIHNAQQYTMHNAISSLISNQMPIQ